VINGSKKWIGNGTIGSSSSASTSVGWRSVRSQGRLVQPVIA
jgi:hypothetical protein